MEDGLGHRQVFVQQFCCERCDADPQAAIAQSGASLHCRASAQAARLENVVGATHDIAGARASCAHGSESMDPNAATSGAAVAATRMRTAPVEYVGGGKGAVYLQ